MRLIDKDALIKLGKKKYLGEDRECFVVKLDVFNNAPTIEAIPIEWLEKFGVTRYQKNLISNIIGTWREEQSNG